MTTNSSLTRVFIISNVILIFVVAFLLIHKKDTKNDLFENNLKCSKYIEQETQKILQTGGSAIQIAPTIFYSPTKQTCINAYIVVNAENDYTGYYIEDILRNDSLYHKGARNMDSELLKEAETGFVDLQKALTK